MVRSNRLQVVIVGDGIAGYTAARAISEYNPSARVTLVGAENVPLYSACALPDYLSGYLKRDEIFIPDRNKKSLKLHKGTAIEKIDTKAQEIWVNDSKVSYDRLIMATGSIALVPPVPGAKLKGNYTLKTLNDVESILALGGKKAVVVGSGAIGVETSIALQETGMEVTLIEMVDRILPTTFDSTPSKLLQQKVETTGVRVLVGERVTKVNGEEQVTGVSTSSEDIDCDLVIWAAGVRSNSTLAQEAGVEIGELRGIKVNEKMETNVDNIYACGDCVQVWDRILGRPNLSLLWGSAKEQAVVAACNSVGIEKIYPGALGVLVEEIGDTTAVSVGYTETALKEIVKYENYEVKERSTTTSYVRILSDEKRVLGAQFVGSYKGAGTIIGWIKKEITPNEIKEIILNQDNLRRAPWFAHGAGLTDILA